MSVQNYNWKRYWVPRGSAISLLDRGYLYPPDSEWGHIHNPGLVSFEAISIKPCLALLGEPGLGKSHTLNAAYTATKASIEIGGGKALWVDLGAYVTDLGLLNGLFESEAFE